MTAVIERTSKKITYEAWSTPIPITPIGMVVSENVDLHENEVRFWGDAFETERTKITRNNRRVGHAAEYVSELMGSGSMMNFVCAITEEASDRGSLLEQKSGRAPRVFGPVKIRDVCDTIQAIRDGLSLNMSDLASLLGVQRPTLYAWTRKDASPQQRNVDRLNVLWQISNQWMRLSGRPLNRHLRHTFDDSSKSLLALLREDPIDLPEVNRLLSALSELPRVDKPESIKEISVAHGLDLKPNLEADLIRDVESGRRLTND
jgi:predicted DNA-binding transcriptional regulator AlpA